jgi:ABC-2 type transport system ATP-binding protein
MRLNREGATVIYTSHYMEEVERICTRIMVMDRGRAIATGTKAELKAMVGIGERIEVHLDQPGPQAVAAVKGLPQTQRAFLDGPTLRVECSAGARNLSEVVEALTAAEVGYGRVYAEPPTLNDVFLELTGKQLRD